MNKIKFMIILFISICNAFDFERAQRKFTHLPTKQNTTFYMDAAASNGASSLAFYKLRDHHIQQTKENKTNHEKKNDETNENISIKFNTKIDVMSNFRPGLVFSIIQNHQWSHHQKSPKISVSVQFDSSPWIILKEFTTDHDLPSIQERFDKVTISTTDYITNWNNGQEREVTLQINLSHLENVLDLYFMVTAYGLVNIGCSCSEISYEKEWWICDSGSDTTTSHRCIHHDLTCDGLPNCGEPDIPNSDENCYLMDEFDFAVKIFLYVVCIIITVIIVFSLTKCLTLRFCKNSTNVISSRLLQELMEQQRADLQAAGPPERPVNSPPTYDDAMKHVNQAFSMTEDDEPDLPPEYTAQATHSTDATDATHATHATHARDATDATDATNSTHDIHSDQVLQQSNELDICSFPSSSQDVSNFSLPSTSSAQSPIFNNNNNNNIINNNRSAEDVLSRTVVDLPVPAIQNIWRLQVSTTRHSNTNNQSITSSSQSMPSDPPPYSP